MNGSMNACGATDRYTDRLPTRAVNTPDMPDSITRELAETRDEMGELVSVVSILKKRLEPFMKSELEEKDCNNIGITSHASCIREEIRNIKRSISITAGEIAKLLNRFDF